MSATTRIPTRTLSNGVQTSTNSSEVTLKDTDVFKQYLDGIRQIARKKQRRCISQELAQ